LAARLGSAPPSAHMLEISPKGSVPVFALDDQVIDESLDIMKWALPKAKFQYDIITIALKLIEDRLQDSAYLDGLEMGPTDMASFPFVRQFAAVEPEWWDLNDHLAKTRNWLALCLESELFKTIMQKHPVWMPGC